MNAKCSECGGISFSIKCSQNKVYCLVFCSNCGSVVGTINNVDFKNHIETITGNQTEIETNINNRISDLETQNIRILNVVENILSKLD